MPVAWRYAGTLVESQPVMSWLLTPGKHVYYNLSEQNSTLFKQPIAQDLS